MRYAVQYETVASSIVYVEADSPEAARDLAADVWQEEQPFLCAHCEGSFNDAPGIEVGEWQETEGEHGVWEASA